MRQHFNQHIRHLACSFGLAFAVPAASQELVQDLGELEAGQALVLPLDIASLTGQAAIEVDGIDVTEFAAVEGGRLVLYLSGPLAGELHDVTVYLLNGDGFEVAASYSFSTAAKPVFSYAVDAAHEAGIRSLNGEDTAHASSSGTLIAETDDGSFRGQLSYLATTRHADRINGNPVEVAEYLLEFSRTAGHVSFTGRLGHHALDYDKALAGDISRRGLSVEMGLSDGRVQFGAFALQSDETLGGRNISGLGNPQNRMHGARAAFQPFASSDLRFSVQSYEGEGDPYGGGTAGLGRGTSVSVGGTLSDGRLGYGAVWSQTDWDEDGAGPLPEAEGDAFLSFASFDVLGTDGGERSLVAGLAYEKVDHGYFSLANPGVATGAETWRVTLDYSASRFGLSVYADTQKTNSGGPADWPVDRISQVLADARYDLQGEGFWQGTGLRFGGGITRQDRLLTPNPALPPEDYTAQTLYLGFDKLGEASSWSLDYARIREDDRSAENIDTLSHSLTAAFDRSFGSLAHVNGSAGYTRVQGSSESWERYEASLGLSFALRPDELTFKLDTGATRTDEPFALEGEYISAELGWRFHPSAELVLSTSRANGPYAGESGEDRDTVIALTLRATTNFFR